MYSFCCKPFHLITGYLLCALTYKYIARMEPDYHVIYWKSNKAFCLIKHANFGFYTEA